MVVVVHCLQVWRVYLLGTQFVVRADNVSNTFFKMQKKLSPKQARWQEILAEYNYMCEHKPGKHNQVVNALSLKEVFAIVYSILKLEFDFFDKIWLRVVNDSLYVKLMGQVQDDTMRSRTICFILKGEKSLNQIGVDCKKT